MKYVLTTETKINQYISINTYSQLNRIKNIKRNKEW